MNLDHVSATTPPAGHRQRRFGMLIGALSAVLMLVAADKPALAAGPPWTVISGLQRTYCNRAYAAAAASLAISDAGFASRPYLDPGSQFATAVNGDTKVVITVDPISASTFWFAIYAASPSSGANLSPWVNAIRNKLSTEVFFDCSGSPGIPVGQNPPPAGTVAISTFWQTKGMPDHCGGFSWCAQVAARAIRDSGLTSSPIIQNSELVVGSNGDTSLAVQCINEGGYAVMSVFASSMTGSTNSWASSVTNRIANLFCL